MESIPDKTKSKMILGAVGAVVVLLVIGGAIYALVSSNKPKASTAKTTPKAASATYKEIKNDLKDLKALLDQQKVTTQQLQQAIERGPAKVKL